MAVIQLIEGLILKPSSSKYIQLESIALTELFRSDPGAVGLYIPVPDAAGNHSHSIARISSAAKRYASISGKRSTIQTLLVLRHEGESDVPEASRMVQVTVVGSAEFSGRSKRYIESGGIKNRKPQKRKGGGSGK